jgi:hypothetical protein
MQKEHDRKNNTKKMSYTRRGTRQGRPRSLISAKIAFATDPALYWREQQPARDLPSWRYATKREQRTLQFLRHLVRYEWMAEMLCQP